MSQVYAIIAIVAAVLLVCFLVAGTGATCAMRPDGPPMRQSGALMIPSGAPMPDYITHAGQVIRCKRVGTGKGGEIEAKSKCDKIGQDCLGYNQIGNKWEICRLTNAKAGSNRSAHLRAQVAPADRLLDVCELVRTKPKSLSWSQPFNSKANVGGYSSVPDIDNLLGATHVITQIVVEQIDGPVDADFWFLTNGLIFAGTETKDVNGNPVVTDVVTGKAIDGSYTPIITRQGRKWTVAVSGGIYPMDLWIYPMEPEIGGPLKNQPSFTLKVEYGDVGINVLDAVKVLKQEKGIDLLAVHNNRALIVVRGDGNKSEWLWISLDEFTQGINCSA